MFTIAAYDRKTQRFVGYQGSETSFVKPTCFCKSDADRLAKQANAASTKLIFIAVQE